MKLSEDIASINLIYCNVTFVEHIFSTRILFFFLICLPDENKLICYIMYFSKQINSRALCFTTCKKKIHLKSLYLATKQ